MLRDMEELGIKYSKIVMDKGFFSDTKIQYESKYSLGYGKPYAKSMIINDYGFRAKVHAYFDNMKFHEETERLYSNLEKRESVLVTLFSKPTSNSDYDKYFIFHENKKDGFSFERNEKLIDETITNYGYFLILTKDLKLSSEEVLEIYRRKDVVE
jgi:transposase